MRMILRIVLYLALVAVVGLVGLRDLLGPSGAATRGRAAGRGEVSRRRRASPASRRRRSPPPCPASPPSRAAPSPGCRRASRSAHPAAAEPRGGAGTARGAGHHHRDPARQRQPRRRGPAAADATGFARALWGPDSPRDVRALIAGASTTQGVPAARALFHRLLLAEADPPRGAADGASVLVARIDRLLGDRRARGGAAR